MRIALIRLSALGDIVLTTAVLEYLKSKNVEITYITYDRYKELFYWDNRIKQVIDYREALELGEYFDIVCDLHAKLKTFLLSLRLKAEKKCRIRKRSLQRRLMVWFKKQYKEVPMYQLFVKPLINIFSDPYIPYPKLIVEANKPEDLPDSYVVIFPGASSPYKRWSLKNFIKVAEEVYYHFQLPTVILGKELFSLPEKQFLINRSGRSDLKYLLRATKYAKLSISNDTGPAHISAALDIPLFVIFGPTVPEFGFRPVSNSYVRVFEKKDLKCRPCSLHGDKPCKFGTYECLNGISWEEVFEGISEFIRGAL